MRADPFYALGLRASQLFEFTLQLVYENISSYPDGVLWPSKVDGSEALQLTFPPMKVFMPRWSPDSRQIAFNATLPGGIFNIYVISSAGGTTEHLLPSDEGQLDVDWSPDGKSLVFGGTVDPKRSIYMIDLSCRRVSALPGSEGFFSPHWSPDGRYISSTTLQSWNLPNPVPAQP